MKSIRLIVIFLLLLTACQHNRSKENDTVDEIISGVPWFDTNGKIVSAHGAGILKENDLYYMFGEYKSDTSNAFTGISCYSSNDLCVWKFEGLALTVQDSGKLGTERVGERPKVMKCPATGEYVMFMHTDDMQYKDQSVGYATSKTITGPYEFKGSILFDGKPLKKWDMGIFQDTDGSGYIITHSGNLYKLSNDYKSITEQVVKDMTRNCESPVIFRKDSLYYWIGSDLTGWERNDNYYFTATKIKGPWTYRGILASKGKLTWNSQSTFVLPVCGSKDTTFIFMGDRWSHPRQASTATYVWQPLLVNGYSLMLPEFRENWRLNISTGEWITTCFNGRVIDNTSSLITYVGNWEHSSLQDSTSDSRSNEKGASCSVTFRGTRVGLKSVAGNTGGYAKVELTDDNGTSVLTTFVDMYSKYSDKTMKFISPKLAEGTYTLRLSVVGEHWYWVEKSGRKSGSLGDYISIDQFIIQ